MKMCSSAYTMHCYNTDPNSNQKQIGLSAMLHVQVAVPAYVASWRQKAGPAACRFVIIPDMLKNAPMFKRIDPKMKVS